MRIAVVGKGGSGKSTVSWLLTRAAHAEGAQVLSIDADYNGDLAASLGVDTENSEHQLNRSEEDFYKYLGLPSSALFVDLPRRDDLPRFSIDPADWFTKKYSYPIEDRLALMVGGVTHKEHLYGHRCTHAYFAPLKYYLPLLKLDQSQCVVIDSVAGTDMVTYGLYLGVDVVACVVEPTLNSMRVYSQVQALCNEFDIPIRIILNKMSTRTMSPAFEEFRSSHEGLICGEIKTDHALLEVNWGAVSEETRMSAQKILAALREFDGAPTKAWGRHQRWLRESEKFQLSQ